MSEEIGFYLFHSQSLLILPKLYFLPEFKFILKKNRRVKLLQSVFTAISVKKYPDFLNLISTQIKKIASKTNSLLR